MADKKVGGDVDAYCTKCKMVLGHTILAMVGERIARVRCNTCQGEHVFKTGAPAAPKPRPAKVTTSGERTKAEVTSFDEVLSGKDVASAKPYSVNDKFSAEQVIDHPTFGRGWVSSVRPDKIDVTFKSFVKTLVHARGGKPAPARPPPMGRPAPEEAEGDAAVAGSSDSNA